MVAGTINDPKNHIEQISGDHKKSSGRTLDGYAGSIDTVKKAFSKRAHFIMEFIQNADDSGAKHLMINLSSEKIEVFNDGKPFTRSDAESICKVGRSSKAETGHMGYLGVGFKSVFLISDNPKIYSSPYKFEFNKNYWSNVDKTPWQVMPIWIEKPLDSKWSTSFIVPFKNPEIIENLKDEIKQEKLNARILLFLRNLNIITIACGESTRNMEKQKETENIYAINDTGSEKSIIRQKWLVFKKSVKVPSNVKQDPMTDDWGRSKVDKREIVVAFKLDDDEFLDEEVKGTAHVGVFSFVPLKEEETGLKFMMQADFITAPGREVITREAEWNKWLAGEIFKLIIEDCVPFLKNKGKWKTNFTKILWPEGGGHSLFEEFIKNPLMDYLKKSEVLVSLDGKFIKPENAIKVDQEIMSLVTQKDIDEIRPGKKILYPYCKTEIPFIDELPTDFYDFITDDFGNKLMEYKAKHQDIKWFTELYEKARMLGVLDKIENEPLILTGDLKLVSPEEVYMNSEKIKVPDELKENFKFVHPEILKSVKNVEFLKSLSVEEFEEEHIKEVMSKKDIPEMSKNWGKYDEREKIEKIKFLKRLRDRDIIKGNEEENKDYNFLTVKTKSGKWLCPKEVLFPKEYNPSHNIEILQERGLSDTKLEFLSPEFIKKEKDHDAISGWNRFFRWLSVDGLLEEKSRRKNIVERIGILSAIEFEEKRGRDAEELGSSKKEGYDIVSKHKKDHTDEIHIEAKGSSLRTDSIFLTANETFKMQMEEEKDKYYVYIVLDALKNPTLNVVKGQDILDILKPKVILTYPEWRDLRKEECQMIFYESESEKH